MAEKLKSQKVEKFNSLKFRKVKFYHLPFPICHLLFTSCLLVLMLIHPAKADIMPYYTNSINSNSIGVYQADKNIQIYKEPNINSKILLDVNWDNQNFSSTEISAGNLFVIYIPKKELAFLTVIDENDDEDWVQVSYNKNGLQNGWIKKDDAFRFMSWRTFFNLYGRKYGLYYMKDAPEESKLIYGSTSADAKSIGKIILPQILKLTSVSGNWLLITAFDVDHTPKIGWIKWRNLSGEIYLFPAIK